MLRPTCGESQADGAVSCLPKVSTNDLEAIEHSQDEGRGLHDYEAQHDDVGVHLAEVNTTLLEGLSVDSEERARHH